MPSGPSSLTEPGSAQVSCACPVGHNTSMKQVRRARFVIAPLGALAIGGALALQALAAPDGWLAVDGLIRFNPPSLATYDWANSGLAGPTGTCPAGAVDVGGTGGLFNCGRPSGGSGPPIAPTLTPAAAADPSIISAVFISNPISTDTTACGAGSNVISGKNGDLITSYGISTGPVPAKDDLSNVYAVSHTRAGNGHPEIYFAAEKLVNNGDSHMDFEFLQSVVGRTAACGGSFTGHRTEGDLLVAVDFTNGGGLAGFSVFQWHCAPLPNPQPADGTVCDPGAGALYEPIAVPAAISLAVDAGNIPCGGWVCRDQISGNSTVVSTNDFLEGGIDLGGIPFTGCFNTFLPHTRTAPSFTAQLKDFAGPVGFRSCRDPAITTASAPTGGNVAPGSSVTDAVTAGNGGAGPVPTGSISFFLCGPAQVTPSGCPSGGTQVGSVKPLVGGAASSDPTTATTTGGTYCWRIEYTPDAAATGVFAPGTHTTATTECFSVVAATLPNTGLPELAAQPIVPALPLLLLLPVPVAFAWRRTRALTLVLIAGLIACSSPSPAQTSTPASHPDTSQQQAVELAQPSPTPTPQLATEKSGEMGWRLVIPRIGVDAHIEPLGLDHQGAMASPGDLDTVGWFNRGPGPGEPGDAVIDGHLGLPSEPAVFRDLRLLRPGDAIQMVWPDGRVADFRVASSEMVAASAQPAGLFGRGGPARLSLITCAGQWEQSVRSYSDRLIVTATPA